VFCDTAPSYIRSKLSEAELLAQLAEEAAELAKAALKLRRVEDGSNPTPVTKDTAVENLMEEITDVHLLLELLKLEPDQELKNQKLRRWASRLREGC
jgi:NTP pyrophosphatase (non-canonical NTP hydrolase)